VFLDLGDCPFVERTICGLASCEWTILSKLSASQSSFCANELKLFSNFWRSRISFGTAVFWSNAVYSAAFARNWFAVNMGALSAAQAEISPDGAWLCFVCFT
jgi:hypothetical protein